MDDATINTAGFSARVFHNLVDNDKNDFVINAAGNVVVRTSGTRPSVARPNPPLLSFWTWMPPRARSPAGRTQQFYPTPDAATFSDLLLFEERLKRNAGALKRRKTRYQCMSTKIFS
ncbi:6803_t:CDS:2 [Acaulospora colombiana]|uniref:6803_t:CDS:1 n=1 Tax=Acaulospora colombiana TaxID=27376 RepID=A0ACA9M4X5_9GLOM|nr:6803_t:CDS:2 [Acaulospora colombiana]